MEREAADFPENRWRIRNIYMLLATMLWQNRCFAYDESNETGLISCSEKNKKQPKVTRDVTAKQQVLGRELYNASAVNNRISKAIGYGNLELLEACEEHSIKRWPLYKRNKRHYWFPEYNRCWRLLGQRLTPEPVSVR